MKIQIPYISLSLILLSLIGCKSSKPQHRKPVIYIYNTQQDTISVRVDYIGELTTTYPLLNDEWTVTADVNGNIKNLRNDRMFSYLYYEGEADYRITGLDEGFSVQTDSVAGFLERKLDQIGLNHKESNDFITFWLPELTQKNHVAIKFLFDNQCDAYSSLNITPTPQSQIRLMIEFIATDNPLTLKQQVIPKITRKSYTVVEWGGINYTDFVEI